METINDLKQQLDDALYRRQIILARHTPDEHTQAEAIKDLNACDKQIRAIRQSLRDEENAP